MSMYEYEINYYSDFNNNIKPVKGIVVGENYADAMKNLENYYGSDIEQINYLRMAENNISVYEFNNSEFGLYKIENITKEQA